MIVIPAIPITVKKPKEFVTEHEKFENNGEWFCDYARWIVLNYYNTYSSTASSYTPTSAGTTTAGVINSQGNPISSGGTVVSLVDEQLDNYAYFFGNQDNRIFNFLTKGIGGNTLPNVMLQGQEIRSLADHMRGKCLEMIQPISNNISCETISQNTLLKRQKVFDKIDLAAKVGDLLDELGGGIKYKPAGDIDYNNPNAVKKTKEKVKEEYENTATVIGRNAYYKCNLDEKFLNAATDTIIGNLAGIEFTEQNDELKANYIPCYQGIYDFSTWGEYGEGQTLGGYIVPVTFDELLHDYPDMNNAWRDELEEVIYGGNASGTAAYMEYYNQPFTNVLWYYNNQKWISKATVYWLEECELPYVEKKNQFGGKKVQKIDPYKTYQVPTEVDGKQTFTAKKGHELRGGTKVWKVHKAVLVGNKYLMEYGYDTYQVRPFGDKRKPEIPIKFFCQGKLGGYVKSVVSRLKPKQQELDAVRYRIRERVATDLYGIFINGAKLTENMSALNIVNDLRSIHVSVITPTGDNIDNLSINDLVKNIDSGTIGAIRDYLVLKQDIEAEMQSILNIPPVALGDQSATVGKGVQDASIQRSELSGLPFYSSLNEYYRRCLQYAANKSKMIMLDSKDKKVILPISNREVKILELTKEMNYEDLNVYLNPDDKMNVVELGVLRQMIQSYGQQPTIENAEAIVNSLKIMNKKSFTEGIAVFESYIEEKKKDAEKQQLQQATTEHQQEAFTIQSQQLAESQKQVADLTTQLAKINLTGAWKLKEMEVQKGIDTEAKLSDAYIEQITGLIQQQLAATSQGAQQPAEQAQA